VNDRDKYKVPISNALRDESKALLARSCSFHGDSSNNSFEYSPVSGAPESEIQKSQNKEIE
jgi:hypothetical protein